MTTEPHPDTVAVPDAGMVILDPLTTDEYAVLAALVRDPRVQSIAEDLALEERTLQRLTAKVLTHASIVPGA